MTRAVILLVVLALCSHASAISDIVAFGDSLTDDCTFGASALVDSVLDTNLVRLRNEHLLFRAVGHTSIGSRVARAQGVDVTVSLMQPYPGVPYYNGCIFSSGPPYSMVAAGILNATLTDNAIGGATSGAVPGYLEVPASYSNASMASVVEVPSSIEQV